LIFAIVLGPEAYRYFKNPTIEDCADFKYIQKNLKWSPDFLKLPASEKLIKQDWNNTGYEYQWSLCEVEKQKLPKLFNEKYKAARYEVESSIKVLEEFLKLRKK